MNIFQAILLGVIQGLTEFLPVSSSGHLVIFQKFMPSFSQPGILFDVFLHFGTILAVLVFYFKRILKLDFKYLIILIIGSIPAAVFGYLLKDVIDLIFQNVKFVGFALLITGIMNIFTDRQREKTKVITKKNSLIIGLFQAAAILPGISRSGSTIFAGSILGINKEKAAEFSFLLSVPAVLGANLLEIIKNHGLGGFGINYFIGFLCAFFVALFCIRFLLSLLSNNKIKYFGYYCLILGVLVLLFI